MQSPAIRIKRVCGERWAPVLIDLQQQSLPHDDLYDTGKGEWWIAFDGATPVGFAGYSPVPSWPGCIYLCRAGVLPSARGRGLQLRLIRTRLRHARRAGYTHALSTTFDNPHSGNNLIRAGFRLYEPHDTWGATGTCYWHRPL